MPATEAETIAAKYDADVVDMDALQTRFVLEMYAHAGDDGLTDADVEDAWTRMDELLTIHTMVALWLDGTLEGAWFPDKHELGFRISKLGREVAKHAFPGVNLDDFAMEA